jgi:hypothetical protein
MIVKLILSVFIIGLFLYSKLLPYRLQLKPEFQKIFGFFSSIFEPILKFLKKFIQPFQVGTGISVDMTQILLLILFLIILNLN